MTLVEDIVVKKLGRAEYQPTWLAMRAFTTTRDESTPDELWLLEHPPVYTVGQGAALSSPGNAIPVLKTDRGGDSDGAALLRALEAAGVATRFVAERPATPTGLAVVCVDPDGDNAIVVAPGANASLGPDDVRAAAAALLGADLAAAAAALAVTRRGAQAMPSRAEVQRLLCGG